MRSTPGTPAHAARRAPWTIATVIAGAVVTVSAIVALAWGATGGETEWSRATARTCASTLARTGYPAPIPEVVDPARFLAERHRLLSGRVGFNTVTPFRRVCSEIRAELDPPNPTLPAP